MTGFDAFKKAFDYLCEKRKSKLSTVGFTLETCYLVGGKIRLNHLAFADDLFLFSHGDAASVQVLSQVLLRFELLSGLAANKEKSEVFFAGVPDPTKSSILHILDFVEGSLPIKYLGGCPSPFLEALPQGLSASPRENLLTPACLGDKLPLLSHFGSRIVYDAALPKSAKVCSIISGSDWLWPASSSADLLDLRLSTLS